MSKTVDNRDHRGIAIAYANLRLVQISEEIERISDVVDVEGSQEEPMSNEQLLEISSQVERQRDRLTSVLRHLADARNL